MDRTERCGSRIPNPRHRRCPGGSRRPHVMRHCAQGGGRRWRTDCPPAGGAGCRRRADDGRCLYRRMHRGRWRRRRLVRCRGPRRVATAHRGRGGHRRPSTGPRAPSPHAPSARGGGDTRATPPPLAEGAWGEGAVRRNASAPRFRAAETPALSCRIRRMRESTKPVTTSLVPSVDPSSTTTSVQSSYVCASTDAIAAPIQGAAL